MGLRLHLSYFLDILTCIVPIVLCSYPSIQTHFSVDTVVGRDGFLVGGEVNYDVLDSKVTLLVLTSVNLFRKFTAFRSMI